MLHRWSVIILCALLPSCTGVGFGVLQPRQKCIAFMLNQKNITSSVQKNLIVRALPARQALSEQSDAVYRFNKYQGSGELVHYFLTNDSVCFNQIYPFGLLKYKIFTSIFIFDKKENNISGLYEYEYYGSFDAIPDKVHLVKSEQVESSEHNRTTLYFDEKSLFK